MIGAGGPITVPTPGTNVWAAGGIANASLSTPAICHGVMFQALPGNTGKVYVGASDMVAGSNTGVFAFIAIPTVNHIPAFSTALTIAPNALNVGDFYVDADVPGDGVIVTYLRL